MFPALAVPSYTPVSPHPRQHFSTSVFFSLTHKEENDSRTGLLVSQRAAPSPSGGSTPLAQLEFKRGSLHFFPFLFQQSTFRYSFTTNPDKEFYRMAKQQLRDEGLCPEFTGQTSPSQPPDYTAAPLLSISVDLWYVQKQTQY